MLKLKNEKILHIIALIIIAAFGVAYCETNQEEKTSTSNSFWKPYMANLEKDIKVNWHPPHQEKNDYIVVMFLVEKDGNLKDLKITEPSKNTEANKAALDAVEKTAPFKPLPKEFTGKSVPIEFSFDYNVLNNEQDNKIDEKKQTNENLIQKFFNFLKSFKFIQQLKKLFSY